MPGAKPTPYSRDEDIYFEFFTAVPKVTLLAHKHILAAGSPIFQKMFNDNLIEAVGHQSTTATPDIFAIFLQSFYDIDISIDFHNVSSLMQLANKYNARKCWLKCLGFLKENLSIESVCFVLDVAWESGWSVLCTLHSACVNIVYEHFNEVIKSSRFIECQPSTLQTILIQRPAHRNEMELIDAVVKWAANACAKCGIDSTCPKNHRKMIGVNFHFIDFNSLSAKDLLSCQRIYHLLEAVELAKIMKKT